MQVNHPAAGLEDIEVKGKTFDKFSALCLLDEAINHIHTNSKESAEECILEAIKIINGEEQ